MVRSKALRWATLTSLTALAAACVATNAIAGECSEAISDESAHKIFDALVPSKSRDGCTLENVGTDHSQMKIEWKKGDRVLEAILVTPTSCAPGKRSRGKLTAMVPPSVHDACPSAAAATVEVVEETDPGDLASAEGRGPYGKGSPSRRNLRLLGGGLAALVAAVGATIAALRRRSAAKRGAEGGDAPKPAPHAEP